MKISARTSFVAASLAALICLTAVGCGGGGHDSPQAAFDAMKAAGDKKDWKGLCECMTPDSRDAMAGGMVVAGTVMKAMGVFAMMGGGEQAEKTKAALERIDEVLKKHGVDEDAMKKVQETMQGAEPKDPTNNLAVLKELAALIEDKPTFIGDMFTVLEEMNPGESPMSFGNAALKDVKIDGDTATGTIAKTVKGTKKNDPINFKKIDGGWLVDIPMR